MPPGVLALAKFAADVAALIVGIEVFFLITLMPAIIALDMCVMFLHGYYSPFLGLIGGWLINKSLRSRLESSIQRAIVRPINGVVRIGPVVLVPLVLAILVGIPMAIGVVVLGDSCRL